MEFFMDVAMWSLGIYGAIILLTTIMDAVGRRHYDKDGVYVVLLVRDREDCAEWLVESLRVYAAKYAKDGESNFIAVDMGSNDDTYNRMVFAGKKLEDVIFLDKDGGVDFIHRIMRTEGVI